MPAGWRRVPRRPIDRPLCTAVRNPRSSASDKLLKKKLYFKLKFPVVLFSQWTFVAFDSVN